MRYAGLGGDVQRLEGLSGIRKGLPVLRERAEHIIACQIQERS